MGANIKEAYEEIPIDQLIDELKLNCLKENEDWFLYGKHGADLLGWQKSIEDWSYLKNYLSYRFGTLTNRFLMVDLL